MRRKGFLFVEILVGLAIFGLVTTTCLPILNISLNNFTRVKDNSEMYYIGERVLERFKTEDPDILELKAQLETFGTVSYTDDSFDSNRYSCQIIRTNSNPNLLEFKVIVNKKTQENGSYVEYKASVPKS